MSQDAMAIGAIMQSILNFAGGLVSWNLLLWIAVAYLGLKVFDLNDTVRRMARDEARNRSYRDRRWSELDKLEAKVDDIIERD